MEYDSAVERNGVLMHAAAWQNLENILLSEIDQTQMYQYFKIPLTWSIYLKYYLNTYLKYSDTKRQTVEQRLPGMRERRSEELLFSKYRASAL